MIKLLILFYAIVTLANTCSAQRPPDAPLINFPVNGSILLINNPAIEGKAEPGTLVNIYLDAYLLGKIRSDMTGYFKYMLDYPMSAGQHILYANVTDKAGNISQVSKIIDFKIDVSAYTVNVITVVSVPPTPPMPVTAKLDSAKAGLLNTTAFESLIHVSNLLTPNGDGKNDTWVIQNIEKYPESIVMVIDITGRLLLKSKNYSGNWDGTFNGKPLNQGTYYYRIQLSPGIRELRGFITLLRN